jgi:hypothetical protein
MTPDGTARTALGSVAGRHPEPTAAKEGLMANPDDVPNRDEPTKSSLRETAAKKTRAVTSATTDVVLDAFDKVIESIDDVATRQQQKAADKEDKAADKQERQAEEKAQKTAAKRERAATAGEERDADPPAQP